MSSKVLQMNAPRITADNFLRTVPTIERSVNFTVQVIANEDGSNRLCQIELPNQEGARAGSASRYWHPSMWMI